jgi:hypothetical protein
MIRISLSFSQEGHGVRSCPLSRSLAFGFALAFSLASCGGDKKGPDPSIPRGSQTHTPPASTGGGRPSNATSYTCSAASDCAYWFCRCADGAVVNSANCTNGYCLDASGACPEACAAFSHGSWTGEYGGGPAGAPPGGNECGGQGSSIPACDSCFRQNCCAQGAACGGNLDCLDYWDCAVSCGQDSVCRADCGDLYPGGESSYAALESCLLGRCASQCR